MSQSSPRLSLPFIQAAQAQKHVTHNEALRALDLLVQLSFEDDAQTAPPIAPSEGECYIVASGGSGDWIGQDGKIAAYIDGAWQFQTPRAGWQGYVIAQGILTVFDGSDWVEVTSSQLQDAKRIGLGMAADASSPFAAKLNAALWSALYSADGGTGSLIQTLNRENGTTDVGLVLQDNFQTRALIGLFGDSNLRFSVTPDGATFHDALSIDTSTGIADQPNLPRFKAHTNYDNYVGVGAWTKLGINVAEYNDQASFDAATNLFTAPVDGTYLLGASLTYKTNGNASARMQGRLVLNGLTAISGTTGEITGTHNSETTTLPLQTLTPLSAGDTVELQGNFRAFDGYMMADETCFWGMKIG
ncbi:conserved hypothetical protein [Rhodobacteraceae bacterium HTCC2083]|jgi:hypothetical protein|nr:conserved hypothetical protein [Rhodobacteraceae bacterium HTCC2083]